MGKYYDEYLMHFGVLGMKWGKRRTPEEHALRKRELVKRLFVPGYALKKDAIETAKLGVNVAKFGVKAAGKWAQVTRDINPIHQAAKFGVKTIKNAVVNSDKWKQFEAKQKEAVAKEEVIAGRFDSAVKKSNDSKKAYSESQKNLKKATTEHEIQKEEREYLEERAKQKADKANKTGKTSDMYEYKKEAANLKIQRRAEIEALAQRKRAEADVLKKASEDAIAREELKRADKEWMDYLDS